MLDMAKWPVFPSVRFGTYKEFFEAASKSKKLTVVEGELNSIFTGCYTSQARIKQANRFGEAKLDEAERFATQSALRAGGQYARGRFEQGWRNILFNQFHDILPGSCVIDAREHAMGIFSETVAASDTEKKRALRALGERADTSQYESKDEMEGTVSEGAGVGFGVGHSMAGMPNTRGVGNPQPFRISQTDRGRGLNRVYHIFNPSAVERREIVELTLFDWPGDFRRLTITDGNDKTMKHQLVDSAPKNFWGHSYVRILVDIKLPACGRHTLALRQADRLNAGVGFPRDPRVEKPHEYILENEYLKAEFCPDSGTLLSLFDKESKAELVAAPAAMFRIIDEQPASNTAGTAWTVGRYRAVSDMSADISMNRTLSGALKNSIEIKAQARSSCVTYTVSLSAGTRWLDFDCDVDWREVGEPGERTQQLNFALPIANCLGGFYQDIPGGLLERPSVNQDMPCQSFSAARYAKNRAIMLMSDSKYGFRCEINDRYGYIAMNLDCLRSSSDPDPYPEFGRHHFRIGIGISEADGVSLMNASYGFCHPASVVSDFPRKGGGAAMTESGIEVSGAYLQAVKLAEEGDALILRLIEPNGADSEAVVKLWADIKSAVVADTHENPAPGAPEPVVDGRTIRCPIRGAGMMTLRVEV
jgi:alpha-mannosidase